MRQGTTLPTVTQSLASQSYGNPALSLPQSLIGVGFGGVLHNQQTVWCIGTQAPTEMDLKSIINVDSSSTVSSRPNPAPVPPARPQYVQSYPSHQHQQSSGGSVPSQQYGGRYDGRPPQPPPIRPPSHPTMGSPSGSISYHSLQSPYGTTPSSASIGGNQYPFPPSDPQSRPLSTQSNHSHYSQRTATGPPPVTQSSMHPAPSPVTPTGGGLTNTYGYPQYQHSPSSQPSYAPLPAPSHVQAYSRDGYPNMHNQNSIQRNSYPPIAQSSQPATPLGPPPSLSRASTMRREGSMSYPYDHQRTQSGSSYGHSPKSAQSSATLERNGSIPLGASPRGSISRPLPVQSQSYVSEGNRERSLSVSPKTRLMYPEPPRFMPMALGQEQQRRWSKSIDAEPGPPPFHDPYKESRPIQPTQYTTAQISPRNNARHSNGVNLIAPLNQYDLESARYTDNHGATKTQNQMPERYHEASVLQRGPSEFDRPHPPILNTQAPPILGKSPFSPSTSHDTFFDQSVARNTSRSPPAIAHAPQIITQTAVATAQTPPATAHSASASFGHSTPQTPLSSHRLATSTEISNHPSRHMPTAYQPSSRRDPSTPSTTQTPTAKSPTAQSSLTKKQEHLQHSPHPTTLDERPVKRPRVVEVPIWARKFDRGQPRKTVICDKSAIQHAQASHVTSSILPTSQQPTAKITTNSYRVAKSQQQHLLDVTSLVNRGNDPPSGLESTIANQEPFEELTREISDFLFTQIVSRPDIGSISANGTPIGPAVLEIEAKLGQLIDPDTGLRYNLPIKTESVFDCDKLGARRRPHFKSIMTEVNHPSHHRGEHLC